MTVGLDSLPAHLAEALEQAKQSELPPSMRDAVDGAKMAEGNPKAERDYAFEIDWTAPNGKRFVGKFVHRIPSIAQLIAIQRATNAGAVGEKSPLDVTTELMWRYICSLEPTLITRPPWAKNLAALPHPVLLEAVAKEAAAHMQCFHGIPDAEGTGVDGAGPD